MPSEVVRHLLDAEVFQNLIEAPGENIFPIVVGSPSRDLP